MLLFSSPALLITLLVGIFLLVLFLFFDKFSFFGNLLGVACIVAYAVLSFLFGASYNEIIVTLLLSNFSIFLTLDHLLSDKEGGKKMNFTFLAFFIFLPIVLLFHYLVHIDSVTSFCL